tara:strand:- start:53 stop:547 length:495 start_codon:yes stop_codon:yes gene_type:complete
MNSNANGRVDILGDKTPDIFQLYDRVPVNNKITSYRQALTGNWENNIVSNAFFSAANIKIIQNGIRAGVYKLSNQRFLIGPQDLDTLKIIMRSIFLQHSLNDTNNVTQQIEGLNKLVMNYSVPQIIGEAEGYVKFKNDVSTMAMPMDRPTSTYSSNTLELKPWF